MGFEFRVRVRVRVRVRIRGRVWVRVVVDHGRARQPPRLLLKPDAGVDRGALFLPEMHVVLGRLEHRLCEANPLLLHVPDRVVGGEEDLVRVRVRVRVRKTW